MYAKDYATKIISLVKEVKKYKDAKTKLINDLRLIDSQVRSRKIDSQSYNRILSKYLKGKTKEQILKDYDDRVFQLLDQIAITNNFILNHLKKEKPKKLVVDKDVDIEYIRRLKSEKEKKKQKELKEGYNVYEPSELGRFANYFMNGIAKSLIKKYPGFFKNLFFSLKSSGTKFLSTTYVSIMLFFGVIAFLVSTSVLLFMLQGNIFFNIIRSIFLGIFIAASAFGLVYIYPASIVKSQRRKMKNELPFVIIHMAAVAGSGAHPISMFKLVLSSEEYPALQGEIKKIVNYVNLFGFDLVGALKAVAVTTPLRSFSELLNGLATTIETGGNLKSYLDAKARDSMVGYRLDRKKYLESLSTYSEVYTGILIAAPLLFFVTLAIIQMMGGTIMGLSVGIIAIMGTYIVIPLLNVGFIIFLNITQPG